jgi:hypothetical protein
MHLEPTLATFAFSYILTFLQKSIRIGGYSYPADGYDGRFEKPTPDVLVDIANNEVINNRIERLQPVSASIVGSESSTKNAPVSTCNTAMLRACSPELQ